ncbi:hypothetical protein AB4920_01755 [Bifidobacterium dentium]|uniref:hypothetical protein n=1 Tax=Bifidobacterium dentium TaxID=1689 RepID=UPI003D178889
MAGLNKEINLPRGVTPAVGMVLGSGMLGLPGIVVAAVGSRMAIASWLAVILAMVPMVAIFSRLGSRYTTAAGLTEYARIAFGPWAADATFRSFVGNVCDWHSGTGIGRRRLRVQPVRYCAISMGTRMRVDDSAGVHPSSICQVHA